MKDFIEEKKQTDFKMQQAYLNMNWKEIIGDEFIAKEVKILYVRDKKIFIQAENSGVKHHINLDKKNILRRICEICSLEMEDLVFSVDMSYGG